MAFWSLWSEQQTTVKMRVDRVPADTNEIIPDAMGKWLRGRAFARRDNGRADEGEGRIFNEMKQTLFMGLGNQFLGQQRDAITLQYQ